MFKTAIAAIAVLTLGISGASASESLKAVVGSYLEIHAALAADKVPPIKAPAAAIVKNATAMGAAGAEIATAAKAVEQAGDLKKAREGFAKLSAAVIAAAKAEGWKDLDGVKLGFCPMAMAPGSWLQKEDKVRNPYYGTLMLECGELKDPRK
jgi:Cu(I)/Ag(I) efflux system membrane fusion protein